MILYYYRLEVNVASAATREKEWMAQGLALFL